ncbi:hypothetical protein NDI56_12545 [Haloarcula sp. S1CR25-12]|uniref:Uncharacterized protein n=2 Tax=Haloarcula saliterrae TaxID=2950534 RepID=A0ABU2FES9_9EURY|nr:hypothetical protein [Haloarcula sp. S1CR25-12]
MLPFIVALIGAIGTIFVRLLTHPRERYYDAARRLQRHRWEVIEAHSPLTSFVQADGGVQTEATTQRTGEMPIRRDTKRDEGFALWNPPSDATARWVIGGLLDDGTSSLPEWIDLNDGDTLADGLDLLKEPRRLYRRCRCSFRESFWLFVGSWLPAVLATVCVFVPQSLPLKLLETALFLITVAAFFAAVYRAYQYWWLRRRLDQEIERAEMF